MNKENLKKLINVIAGSDSFSMHAVRWVSFKDDKNFGDHPCGTPACIMGHALQIKRYHSLVDFLGVSKRQHKCIVCPSYDYANLDAKPGEEGYITKFHALRMLKKLLKTGEIDWKGTKNPPKFDMKTWLSDLQAEENQKEKAKATHD